MFNRIHFGTLKDFVCLVYSMQSKNNNTIQEHATKGLIRFIRFNVLYHSTRLNVFLVQNNIRLRRFTNRISYFIRYYNINNCQNVQ